MQYTEKLDGIESRFEHGVLIRTTGDIIALSPPLIVSKAQIDEIVGTIAACLKRAA